MINELMEVFSVFEHAHKRPTDIDHENLFIFKMIRTVMIPETPLIIETPFSQLQENCVRKLFKWIDYLDRFIISCDILEYGYNKGLYGKNHEK